MLRNSDVGIEDQRGSWVIVERRTGALATDTKFKTDLQAWRWIVNTLEAARRRELGE